PEREPGPSEGGLEVADQRRVADHRHERAVLAGRLVEPQPDPVKPGPRGGLDERDRVGARKRRRRQRQRVSLRPRRLVQSSLYPWPRCRCPLYSPPLPARPRQPGSKTSPSTTVQIARSALRAN